MVRAILVDDEPRGINTLKKLLQDYCPEVRILAECTDADDAKEKIELLAPQLVFLDISMPGKNSFDLLAELEEINFEIVFVTAYNEYTLQALHYSAVDYLMKPIDEDLLVEAVKRARKRIALNNINNNVATLLHNVDRAHAPQDMKLCIHSLKGFQVVDLRDVLFCEASGSYTNFHFADKHVICTAKTILEYEELLKRAGFARIHKSFLVNLLHIKEYLRGEGGSVILSNGKELEVSRRKKEIFLAKMKDFYRY
jgi:two-component system, LytTR family, response regulator